MILIAIGFVIMFISFFDFKKGYFLYLIYQIFWFYAASVIVMEDFPVITIDMIMSTWFLMLFLINRAKNHRTSMPMPYRIPLILIICSMILTCFTSVGGFQYEITRAVSLIVQNISFIWISWYTIETEKDFKFLIKGYIIVFFAASVFGLIEYAMQSNPLVDYKAGLTANGIRVYTLASGRGYRLISVFEHSIGAGMTLGLFSVFILLLFIQGKDRLSYRKLALITALLCIPCIMFSKMRSAMLFTVIAALSIVNFRRKRFYKILALFGLLGVVAWSSFSENIYLFLSIFMKEYQSVAGGSSLLMRLRQFEAVWNLMMISPVGGLGEKFGLLIVNDYTRAALDYESLWFEQMAKHGMVGVIVHIVLIVYSVIIIPRKYHSKEIFFISASYWATYTMTSVPSFRLSFYYFVLFYLIKNTSVYKNMVEQQPNTLPLTNQKKE